jgi:hypothetical protein
VIRARSTRTRRRPATWRSASASSSADSSLKARVSLRSLDQSRIGPVGPAARAIPAAFRRSSFLGTSAPTSRRRRHDRQDRAGSHERNGLKIRGSLGSLDQDRIGRRDRAARAIRAVSRRRSFLATRAPKSLTDRHGLQGRAGNRDRVKETNPRLRRGPVSRLFLHPDHRNEAGATGVIPGGTPGNGGRGSRDHSRRAVPAACRSVGSRAGRTD